MKNFWLKASTYLLTLIIGIILGLWGYATWFCNKEVSYVQAGIATEVSSKESSIKATRDTVYVDKVVFIRHTDTLYIPIKDTIDYLKGYFSINEYNKTFSDSSVCIDVNSLVFQNELADQKVSYSLVSSESGHNAGQSVPQNKLSLFLGSTYSFQPSSLNIALTIQTSNIQVYGSRSLNRNDWTVGLMKRVK